MKIFKMALAVAGAFVVASSAQLAQALPGPVRRDGSVFVVAVCGGDLMLGDTTQCGAKSVTGATVTPIESVVPNAVSAPSGCGPADLWAA